MASLCVTCVGACLVGMFPDCQFQLTGTLLATTQSVISLAATPSCHRRVTMTSRQSVKMRMHPLLAQLTASDAQRMLATTQSSTALERRGASKSDDKD